MRAACRILLPPRKQRVRMFPRCPVTDSAAVSWPRDPSHARGPLRMKLTLALRIFELPGRDTNIEKRAADRRDSKLIENADAPRNFALFAPQARCRSAPVTHDVLDRAGSRSKPEHCAQLSTNASVWPRSTVDYNERIGSVRVSPGLRFKHGTVY